MQVEDSPSPAAGSFPLEGIIWLSFFRLPRRAKQGREPLHSCNVNAGFAGGPFFEK
jgi:hypothetical protein